MSINYNSYQLGLDDGARELLAELEREAREGLEPRLIECPECGGELDEPTDTDPAECFFCGWKDEEN